MDTISRAEETLNTTASGLTTFSGIVGLYLCNMGREWNWKLGYIEKREEIGTKNKKSMIDDRGRKLKCRNI